MKKLVALTAVMVFAVVGMAFADDILSDNIVPVAVDHSVAVSANNNKLLSPDVNVDVKDNRFFSPDTNIEVEGNRLFSPDTKVEVENSLNGNTLVSGHGQVGNNSNQHNLYVVDNAVLANVNVEGAFLPFQPINFNKSQHAEIDQSFHDYNGVSNTNSAAGNLNNQTAYTSIKVGSGSIGGATTPSKPS